MVGVDYPGQPPRYEWADGEDKVHFACRICDKLFALEDTTEDTPPAKAPKGFQVQGFEVMLMVPALSAGKEISLEREA